MSDYSEIFGREPEPWREPLGALRLTLMGDPSAVDVRRAQHEVEDLVRVLNEHTAAADAVGTVPPLHPDEREPIAKNPLLRGVDLALDRLIRRDCFTDRTLRVIDELREELARAEQ